MTKKKSKASLISNILLLICAIVFIYSTGTLVKFYFQYKKIDDNYNAIKDEVVVDVPETEGKYPKVDVKALIEKNPNCIGYFMIPGTTVSYPLMQTTDNSYYLEVGFDETWSNGGSIFIDYRNNKNFQDHNTIIYGHNMKNGSMFAPTAKYLYDGEFFNQHPTILIYREKTIDVYTVFSCVETTEGSSVYDINFPSKTQLKEHIIKQAEASSYEPSIIPSDSKHIITLSTCRYSEGVVRICTLAALTEQLPND